jgi:hypothetical protein
MAETWACPRCGQLLPLSEGSCGVCHITRENRNLIGRIAPKPRSEKPPAEAVEVVFPFVVPEARFNLPLPAGSLWSSGSLVCVPEGIFLASAKDGLDPAALAAAPPPVSAPVGPASVFAHRSQIVRVVHHKLTGYFLEVKGGQKIPLRLEAPRWADLDVVCDRLGIAHT